jgi:hypothetical protein
MSNRTAAPARDPASRRRGGTTAGLITALLVAGGLTATAVIVTPRALKASGPTAEPARHPAHQDVMEIFGALVARSHAVLAIHPPGATPYQEIVLWLEDGPRVGAIEAGEVAVVSHSPVMRTIALHTLAPASVAAATPIDRAAAAAPAFCSDWRDHADVTRTVLAHGITRLVVEPVAVSGGAPMLRISFTWAVDSSDGPDDGSVLLEAATTENP